MTSGGSVVTPHDPVALAAARAAIVEVTPRFIALLRAAKPGVRAVGDWGVGEVACHVSHVFRADTDALVGRPLPRAALNPAAVAVGNDDELAQDPERDLTVLAARIDTQLGELLRAVDESANDQVTWVGDARIPASAAACHLLEELLMHGHDIAIASSQPWSIDPEHAALALYGAAAPIVNAADSSAFVDMDAIRGMAAKVAVRLRTGQGFTFVFDEGLRVMAGAKGKADIYVSADPTTFLLLMLGRIGPVKPFVTGKVLIWGRRPWLLPRILGAISPP